eukprot:596727-Amphidinium_carterae.2
MLWLSCSRILWCNGMTKRPLPPDREMVWNTPQHSWRCTRSATWSSTAVLVQMSSTAPTQRRLLPAVPWSLWRQPSPCTMQHH